MMFITLFVCVLCIINHGIAQDVPTCRTENTCDCCNSNPDDGTRDLLDICDNQQETEDEAWRCTYGCLDGYYGRKCFNKCPKYCTRCAREFGIANHKDHTICYLCADGYYNGTGITNCSTPCPANCAENQCDKTSGICLFGCKGNWSRDKCNVCADTWYGNNCDMQCPDYCKDRKCDRNDECTTGCADKNFTGSKCNQCVEGKYGDYCDKTCSVHCRDETCERIDGQCSNGCTGNFDGEKCDICQAGHHGTNCDKWCYSCLNGLCDRTTGRCIDCVNGKFGEQCDKTCSTDCLGGECSREYGACTSCKVGYYGQTCNKTCPDNCLNNVCGQYNGICYNCSVGYYSKSCDFKCQSGCIKGICTQDSGYCTYGCENGNSCNKEPQTSSYTGEIVGGIIAGFVIVITLINVIWFVWTRRHKNETKNDPPIQVNDIYENNQADPDGYEELQIPNYKMSKETTYTVFFVRIFYSRISLLLSRDRGVVVSMSDFKSGDRIHELSVSW